MSDISTIETLVRYQIGDFSHSQIPGDIFTYVSSSVFTLSEANVISVTAVYKNGSALTAGQYSFNSSTNKITISASLSADDSIEVQYTYYPQKSSAQIEAYIRAAVIHLSMNGYYTFEVDEDDNFYPELTDREKNLVAFITAILIKPDNVSYRLPDISFTVPKSLPTRDLISRAVAIFKKDSSGVFDLGDPVTLD